jgi:hypothetical protein
MRVVPIFVATAALFDCSATPPVVDAPVTTQPAPRLQVQADSAPQPDAGDDAPFRAGELWRGTYLCAQGVTELQLHIERVDGLDIGALFEFAHTDSGASGEFEMSGAYKSPTRRLRLVAGKWLSQPPGYVAVDMEGRVSPDGRSYSGRITTPGCGEFSVRRVP